MLQVCSLAFEYEEKLLFDGLHFSVSKGQLLHLKGDNGSGKTTLLRLLAGLLLPAAGTIFFDGKPISENRLSYQQQICYVGHKTGLNPLLSIRENCYFDFHWQRRSVNWNELINIFSLEDLVDKPCYQLSAGQKRRAALLRLAMTNARLWLLDEPLVALDQSSIQILTNCLLNHLLDGGQIVMTSHQKLPSDLKGAVEYALS